MDLSGARRRVGDVADDLRRAALVRRRLLSAVLVGVVVLAVVRAVAPPPEPTVSAVVAARDMPAGVTVRLRDVATEALPPTTVPDGAVRNPVGRTLATAVSAGEVLTDSRLVGPSLLEGRDGQLAVPVRIPDADAVGLLRVGDRIDLFAADPAAVEPTGVQVLEAARVLALPAGTGDQAGATRGRLVVLAATPAQVADLSGYAARGLLTIALSR